MTMTSMFTYHALEYFDCAAAEVSPGSNPAIASSE